jgi:hypothetical protein
MKKKFILATLALACAYAHGGVDSDFKPNAQSRFVVYTGDGNYKQAYHWAFNQDGNGPPVTVFLNHGSGSEWYDEIENTFGLCGPDYTEAGGDFSGTEYEGLCELDADGNRIYLADYSQNFVPVGSLLERFMLRKIVGSSKFAAWYWQDAFSVFDSPVHVFMVGRYNIAKQPTDLNNVLFWLNVTEPSDVSRETMPPYNFDGYGLSDLDDDDRPVHAAPDISAFDNMFLYKTIKVQFPDVSLDNVIIEGRSNGGSAMVALAADYHIWPQHIKEFWQRNLLDEPLPIEEPVPQPRLDLNAVIADPLLTDAFNRLLSQYTAQDVVAQINAGYELQLYANNELVEPQVSSGSITYQSGEGVNFDSATFREQLTLLTEGDFYRSVKLVHSLYPGCRLDGYMRQDTSLIDGEINANGDNAIGYQVALPILFSFAEQDSLYTTWCDDRISQASQVTNQNMLIGLDSVIDGRVFDPAGHGFDYGNVYKNLDKYSLSDRTKSEQARQAIERAVNQMYRQMGLEGTYSLPYDLN